MFGDVVLGFHENQISHTVFRIQITFRFGRLVESLDAAEPRQGYCHSIYKRLHSHGIRGYWSREFCTKRFFFPLRLLPIWKVMIPNENATL